MDCVDAALFFSFSCAFFFFLCSGRRLSWKAKIYFMWSKINFMLAGHKKEKLFSSEKEKIVIGHLCLFGVFGTFAHI